ncbi:MAG: CoA transferase [Acidobacteria bacterium]|nr:CoA transferase [Acidobacteriota bacterium]
MSDGAVGDAPRASWGAEVLPGTRVVELSSGVAGAFCARVLADAGAEVVKVEDARGDALRRWSPIAGEPVPGGDSPLFRYLAESKRGIVADPGEMDPVWTLLADADVVLWSPGSAVADALDPRQVAARCPEAVVCALTPFGLDTAWTGRPASDLVLQAWAGGIGHRGGTTGPPVAAGGQLAEWATGVFATVSVLESLYRARTLGGGELLDASMLEAVATGGALAHPVTFLSLAGRPMRDGRVINMPTIHPAKDGWVGFMVLRGQQWQDFCLLVGQPQWIEDESLLYVENRVARLEEMTKAINDNLAGRTVDEVLEMAEALRVPAAPVGNGATTPTFRHPAAMGQYERAPDGAFLQPTPWFRIATAPRRQPPTVAPQLGEHPGASFAHRDRPVSAPNREATQSFPLAGLRVADLTAYWAGPMPGRFLAAMGADVIKVESPIQMDGFRSSVKPDDERWWEWSPMVAGINVGKRHLGLDLSKAQGRDALLRLVEHCDLLIENYTPRVLENWGLTHDVLLARNPDLLVVRMPAYGLEGPWRDRQGYAQTMEMTSGMAWTTGFPDSPPMLPNGQVDPLGGNMALISVLLALHHRRAGGSGTLVESPLLGAALALAAEQVVEHSATGRLVSRIGNRHPLWAPQGVYACRPGDDGRERYVALSVRGDDEWRILRAVLGDPAWAAAPALDQAVGRYAAHDQIDAELGAWCAARSDEEVVDALWPRGVPAGQVLMPSDQLAVAALATSRYYELVDHPVMGTAPYQTFPVRFSRQRPPLIPRRSPLLGEHNRAVLGDLVGMTDTELAELEASGALADRPPPRA